MPIVSPNSRIRHPDEFVIGDHSIVDDYCYFSTRVRIGDWSHVASGCSIAGGADRLFTLGNYSSVSSGVKIWCTSDDFVRDIVTIVPSGLAHIKRNLIIGDVSFADLTAVGANSVVMPRNAIPEGTTIGALSFVPPEFDFEPWSVYAGVPIHKVNERDRDSVLAQLAQLMTALAEET